jgi:hypothetical protein
VIHRVINNAAYSCGAVADLHRLPDILHPRKLSCRLKADFPSIAIRASCATLRIVHSGAKISNQGGRAA